jgi:hypothetical protein
MSVGHNVNENGFGTKHNYNDNDRGGKYNRSKQIEVIADRLMEKLGASVGSRPFLCKVAWKQPEHRIWANVEQALKGKNPMGLFIYLSKRDGV